MSKRKEMLTNDKLAAPSKRPSQSEAGPLLRGEFGEDGRKALSQPPAVFDTGVLSLDSDFLWN